MDKFLNYFEDKRFVQWVLQPNEKLDRFWNYYIKNNPDEKKNIQLARTLISQLQSKQEDQKGRESIALFSGIIEGLEKREKKRRIQDFFTSMMKYAAVGLFFFVMGMGYYYFRQPGPLENIPDQVVINENESNARLILGSGENVAIREKVSKIEYQDNGKIIINRQDTLMAEVNAKQQELNQLVVPFGKNSSIRLPDGTIAYLNAGSRLVYPSFFKGKYREVFLIGEGYFNVSTDKKMPFLVKTNELTIKALGTKFNVSAYPSENVIETVLVEGKVEIKKKGFSLLEPNYTLDPNQLAVFKRTSTEMEIKRVDVINHVAWHDGFLNFESVDLSRIIKKLERYYNIRIILDDPMMGVRSISGKILLKEEKEKVLAVLATTASAEYVKLNEATYVIK